VQGRGGFGARFERPPLGGLGAVCGSAAAAVISTAVLTPRAALPALGADASWRPETSLRYSSSSASACRPRRGAWSLMLVTTLWSVATAVSAVSKVKWMVQSTVVTGVLR